MPLLPRAFELRDNPTVYDHLHAALAEALDAPLPTRDCALERPGPPREVEVIGRARVIAARPRYR